VRQAAVPQDADDSLPGSYAADGRGPTGAGPAAGATGRRSGQDNRTLHKAKVP
jgi:hypothetical protein